ncbi:MAG TPA: methyl-accepting chemotaxis protein [Noviherbaspirillum sp.]|uniref:methyl-accepting chemotaxis protein n=1 Tax=Noviherbaspirillum sp. TaxID=1926288 RepID=UPI002B4A9EDD|nr:methyl-accepting chemotaxis protein [Noviherbaspirillum sp.]HJV85959.1 methyl-accepting chemotaxis protein [Noviherbaspirillum sp.]
MRNNQPVTGQEYFLRPGQSLISRTDTKGRITYANRDFVEASGFTEDELIGSPHNIVRHPDMPRDAFEDLWRSLKAGRAWTGLVKNRRKNGDHYWVQANATPVSENGKIIGYTSVRTLPTREQVQAAEATYAKFRNGRARGIAIREGQVVRTGLIGAIARLGRLRVAAKINLVLILLCFAVMSVSVICLHALSSANATLRSMYESRTAAMRQLDTITWLLSRDENAILEVLSSPTPELTRQAQQQYEENEKVIGRAWKEYQTSHLTDAEKQLGEQFTTDYKLYVQTGLRPALVALRQNDVVEAQRIQNGVMKPAFAPVRKDINGLLDLKLKTAKEESEAAELRYATIRNVVVGTVLLAFAFAGIVAKYLSKTIVRPLREAVDVAKQIAACNLTAQIRPQSTDETGELMHALDTMKQSLANIVAGVRTNAESIATGASQIAAGNADLATRTEEQAANLGETTGSIEQLTATVQNNAERSATVKTLVEQARDTASQGGHAMARVVTTMNGITNSSRLVTDITAVIDTIAFQTNILALNAAVEAARAGELGRGFAVVAAEVRTLAQRSAAAAKEIKDLISFSVSEIQLGSQEVSHAQQTMESIVASVEKVADLIGEISSASLAQSQGIEQVNVAVAQMDQVTHHNASLVDQAAAASESMRRQCTGLLQEVAVFRLNDGESRHT